MSPLESLLLWLLLAYTVELGRQLVVGGRLARRQDRAYGLALRAGADYLQARAIAKGTR